MLITSPYKNILAIVVNTIGKAYEYTTLVLKLSHNDVAIINNIVPIIPTENPVIPASNIFV